MPPSQPDLVEVAILPCCSQTTRVEVSRVVNKAVPVKCPECNRPWTLTLRPGPHFEFAPKW